MKAGRFNDLALPDKAWLVYEFGNLLYTMEYYDHRIHLYELNSNYVELYYNIATRQIDNIAVANYKSLDKYLSRIVIGTLKKQIKR